MTKSLPSLEEVPKDVDEGRLHVDVLLPVAVAVAIAIAACGAAVGMAGSAVRVAQDGSHAEGGTNFSHFSSCDRWVTHMMLTSTPTPLVMSMMVGFNSNSPLTHRSTAM